MGSVGPLRLFMFMVATAVIYGTRGTEKIEFAQTMDTISYIGGQVFPFRNRLLCAGKI